MKLLIYPFGHFSNLETLPPIESTITNSDGGFTVQLKMQTTPTAWVPLTEEVFPVEFGADLSLIVTHGKNCIIDVEHYKTHENMK